VKAAERISDAPIIPRSITDVIETSIKTIQNRFSDVQIFYTSEEQQIVMNVDRYLETLIINLLENAILHNPNKSRQIWINLQEQRMGFEISVSDNGPGIDDHQKRDIFDKNRRFGGVGLHVARQIAQKYGGNLEVTDRIEGDHTKGAEFRLWIPEPIVRWG
jgi:K+-sensing histidine kinase KdpD